MEGDCVQPELCDERHEGFIKLCNEKHKKIEDDQKCFWGKLKGKADQKEVDDLTSEISGVKKNMGALKSWAIGILTALILNLIGVIIVLFREHP